MPKLWIPLFLALCGGALSLPACDDSGGDAKDAKDEDAKGKDAKGKDAKGKDAKGKDAKGDGGGAAGKAGAGGDAAVEAAEAAFFDPEDKAFRKRACEFLTAKAVADTFDVPETELKQFKMMGCMYNWKKDGQIVQANVMMLRVNKTTEGAQLWFKNLTATKTAEEIAAEFDKAKAKVKDHEAIDTKMKKKVAGDMADIAKMGTPKEGVSYQDVPGIGDEARVSSVDGVMWVRLGNLTFQVAGYKGPDQPQPEIDPKNLKGMAKVAIEAQKKWIKETLEQRKEGSAKLAPKVVEAIRAL